MSTNNAENFNFKINNLADNRSTKPNKKKEKRVLRPPTLKFIFDTIDKKDYDPLVKEELKKSASNYPHHGLQRWIDNYDQFLAKARRDVRDKTILESTRKANEKKLLEEKQSNENVVSSTADQIEVKTNETFEEDQKTSTDGDLPDLLESEFDSLPGEYDPTA